MKTYQLTQAEATSSQGCGAGTEGACHALMMGGAKDGWTCAHLYDAKVQSGISIIIGTKLSWRVNVDPSDGKAWCPRRVLNNSKQAPGQATYFSTMGAAPDNCRFFYCPKTATL